MSGKQENEERISNTSEGFTENRDTPAQSNDDALVSPEHPGYERGRKYQQSVQELEADNEESKPLSERENAEEFPIGVEVVDAAQQGRAVWDGKVEFFLTCVGYAVGLGNVWRFPYLCYKNGGGAFLLPYCIMLAVVGLPIFFLELSFGQFASLGPLTIWRISPLFKGLGVSMVMVSLLLSVYYNVIVAQCLIFLVASFNSELPWYDCGHYWNSENCQRSIIDGNSTLDLLDVANCTFETKNQSMKCRTPSEEFYERLVLGLTDGIENYGDFNWRIAIALLIAWVIVTLVLLKGIQSLGKVSYFTAIFPYIMLTILLIRSAMLPGAANGVLFYVKPKWSRLLDYKVWMEAATQIFFSLSCCNGGLIAMSSYNKFKNNCQRDSVLVALINCGTSVFAGFVIFCNLGYMAHKKQVSVEKVAKDGPGLAFIVYPEALSQMPLSPLWAVLFFVMMATLGFGSQFSISETVLSSFEDELRSVGLLDGSRKQAVLYRVGFCSLLFLLGMSMSFGGGMYLLNLIDNAISTFPLLICGIVELVVLMHIYGFKQFSEDIKLMVGGVPNIYWRVTWTAVTPIVMGMLVLLMIFKTEPLTYGNYVYPHAFQVICILIGVFVVCWIPVMLSVKYCREGGLILFKEFLKPVEDWGPAKPKYRGQFLENIAKSRESLDANFFQSKASAAAELHRTASKESGLNRTRTHTNSFSGLHASNSLSQFANIDQKLIASAANLQTAQQKDTVELHPQPEQWKQQQQKQQQQVPFSSFVVGADKDDMQTEV